MLATYTGGVGAGCIHCDQLHSPTVSASLLTTNRLLAALSTLVVQVMLDLAASKDLVLLSVPEALLTTHQSLALLDGTFTRELSLCGPTSIAHYIDTNKCFEPLHLDADERELKEHGGDGGDGGNGGDGEDGRAHPLLELSAGAKACADCVVVWIESNWGAGGWLSTGPAGTPYAQQVLHFLPESVDLARVPCAVVKACYSKGTIVAIGVQSANV